MQTYIRPTRLAHLTVGVLISLALVRLYFLVPFPKKPDQIEWTPYSLVDIHKDLEEGKLVLLSVKANWDLSTVWHEHFYSEDPAVLNLVRSQPITCYNIDIGELPHQQFEAWRGYFDSLSPLGVILLAQNSNHEILKRVITTEGIYQQQLIPEIKKLRRLQTEPAYSVTYLGQ
ncbi:hypothetical protein [Gimesia sp.]|uniref:hypothetical protein n=1 Tax=Gimesia sp. TaxID=2024833 RepID=UPI003A94369A